MSSFPVAPRRQANRQEEGRRTPSTRQALRFLFWLVATGILAVGIPLAFAVYADTYDHGNWHLSDWVTLLSSTIDSVVFFVLAWIIGRSGQQRARAVADAELITSMGALAMSGARSFAGDDRQGLRIAADARAALQHYPSASTAEQETLAQTVKGTYTNLAFGTLSRADSLPRSVWTELDNGMTEVSKEVDSLIDQLGRRARSQQQGELRDMQYHIRFVQEIGKHVRAQQRAAIRPGESSTLISKSTPDGVNRTVRRFQCLYEAELTVIKQWAVITENCSSFECDVELSNIEDIDCWFAPWYLERRDGVVIPVNVKGENLGHEPAGDDRPQNCSNLTQWPTALRHDQVPVDMRAEAVANMCKFLERQRPITVNIQVPVPALVGA